MSSDSEAVVARFEELVTQYGRVIRSAVRQVAGRQADRIVDDVEQQVLIALWKLAAREQEIEHPSSYLYRAAVRETVRWMRRLQRESSPDLATVTAIDRRPEASPDRRAAAGELARRLRERTASLAPDRQRAVQAHLAGYRVQEIMEMFDWPYQRARNLIARGMADLRRALSDDDAVQPDLEPPARP